MKLVLYEQAGGGGGGARAGALVDGGVADLTPVLAGLEGGDGQRLMENVIDAFDERRSEIERVIAAGPTAPLDGVRLLPPLPRPRKILCCIGNYWEHAQRERGR